MTLRKSMKNFYRKSFPGDSLGEEISKATFRELLDGLKAGANVYGIIGVSDSVIRERLFAQLAVILGVDTASIYDLWG